MAIEPKHRSAVDFGFAQDGSRRFFLPEIHHSNQGVQYAANDDTDFLNKNNVQICMAAIGKAQENRFAERLMSTIKEEQVDLTAYVDFADAYAQIQHFIEQVYHYKRIHSSLGYLPQRN